MRELRKIFSACSDIIGAGVFLFSSIVNTSFPGLSSSALGDHSQWTAECFRCFDCFVYRVKHLFSADFSADY